MFTWSSSIKTFDLLSVVSSSNYTLLKESRFCHDFVAHSLEYLYSNFNISFDHLVPDLHRDFLVLSTDSIEVISPSALVSSSFLQRQLIRSLRLFLSMEQKLKENFVYSREALAKVIHL